MHNSMNSGECGEKYSFEEDLQKFSEVKTKLSQLSMNRDKYISVNVGGQILTVFEEVLTVFASKNFLFTLLSPMYRSFLPRDSKGNPFLDLDSRWVEPTFNYLRDYAMWASDEELEFVPNIHPIHMKEFTAFTKYFNISTSDPQRKYEPDSLTEQSILLKDIPNANVEADLSMVSDEEGKKLSVSLLYRGSRDGFNSTVFNTNCDGEANTLTLISDVHGNVFGSFVDIALTRKAATPLWIDSPHSFLFSLSHHDVVKTIKHEKLENGRVRCQTGIIAGFGSLTNRSLDLWISEAGPGKDRFICRSSLGNGFAKNGRDSLSTQRECTIDEIEVFSVDVVDFKEMLAEVVTMSGDLKIDDTQAKLNLYDEVSAYRDDLHFIARFVGVELPMFKPTYQVSKLRNILKEVDAVTERLIVAHKESVDNFNDSSLVSISVGGKVVAVSKATLQQAPSGSILANMASDEWGHDLDSDGNIMQDVNSELFTAIINHLRLKTLLSASEVPPIVVHKEQKIALDNLLLFYMLSELPVKILTRD